MKSSRTRAFTLIELLVVIAIIAILAALVLQAATFIQKKGARARAETEISALENALESYKADNGDYPNNSVGSYAAPGNNANLVAALMPTNGSKVYLQIKAKSLVNGNYVDPFGIAYGYDYVNETSLYNGTNNYDIWCTVGGSVNPNVWIRNW